MSKKLVFPVAKIRQDGTPAIWLTFGNWLLLEPGIVRAYLDNREGHGRHCVRWEKRRELKEQGADWRSHEHLKDWGLLDSWDSWSSNAQSSMELFAAGYEAWKHVADPGIKRWTPESLKAAGDRHEERGRQEELQYFAKQCSPKEAPCAA